MTCHSTYYYRVKMTRKKIATQKDIVIAQNCHFCSPYDHKHCYRQISEKLVALSVMYDLGRIANASLEYYDDDVRYATMLMTMMMLVLVLLVIMIMMTMNMTMMMVMMIAHYKQTRNAQSHPRTFGSIWTNY